MDSGLDTQVQQVRQFNRTVTQRAGALNDAFLARARPLGQARLLWEIGPDGAVVRELRSRLGLDSGYVSRMLRSLEADGLGCGALKFHPGAAAEIKRMWISPAVRGLGLGRRMLGDLEDRVRAAGAPMTRLETNRVLTEAIALYRACGYREVPAFNDEAYAHHWFEKALAATPER
jgi:ribosomal protein S18 acetylase RimI-like enzyme